MQRNDSMRQSIHQANRRSSQQIGGWRPSLTISSVAQQDAYLAQKVLSDKLADAEEPPIKPISWFGLYRFATRYELALVILGLFTATLNGLCVPVGVIIYGEFTGLLLERTLENGTTTPTLIMPWFGGGRILTDAPEYERRVALVEDSVAFAIACTVLSVLQFLVGWMSVDCLNYTALHQIDRLRERFLRAVLRQDMEWYDTNTSMNFATKVSDDLEKFREGIAEKAAMLTYLVMSFITAVVISMLYGWELTLVILSCTPVIIGTTAVVAKVQSSLTSKELEAYSVAGVIAEEVLGSIRTVVAFGGEEKETKRYTDHLLPATGTGKKRGVYSGVGSGVMWFIIYATYAISFWHGVNLILGDRGKIDPAYTPGVLMTIFFCVLSGAQNVGLTSPHIEAMNNARAAAGSLLSVIDRVPAIDSMSTEGEKPKITGKIVLKDVFFKYPARNDVQVLNGLNLQIDPGEIIALVGPSGCGKSTVLQLIQRLYDPESGAVEADGVDLRNINLKHLRSHIAVVGQEPVLFAGTIRENIRLSRPSCTDEDIELAARQAYCHNFIKKLPEGYDTMIGERGAQLSGGQKQRIAIARALVRRPTILLLDEATSALDSHSEAKVQRALDDAAHGRTTIMVSHRLATVVNATKVIFIDKGQVVEQGTHYELLKTKGRYYQLVKENDPSLAEQADKSTTTQERPKLSKLVSIESMQSQMSVDSIESDESNIDFREDENEREISKIRILKMCAPEKKLMIIGTIAAMAVGSSFPLFAILFGELYGLLASNDDDWVRTQASYIALIFLGVGVYTGIGIFFQIYVFNSAGVQLTARLRKLVFETMLKQEIGWYDDATNGIGALTARLAADAAAVQGATGSRIGALVQASSTIVIGVLLSLYYTWKMTLVSLVSVPVVLGAVYIEAAVLTGGMAAMKATSDRATTIATEAISNIRTVASFCGEEGVIKRYVETSKGNRSNAYKSVRWRGIVFSLSQSAPFFGYALSLWYGGVLVSEKEVPYKDVIKVSEALIFGAWMMGQALAFAPNFGAAIQAAGRVFDLLDRESRCQSPKSPSTPPGFIASGKIQYKSIEFSYPTRREQQILKGLTLEIASGKRIALVGPSGCGKSTLIQLLQRLYDPDDGQVFLDGYSITQDMTLGVLRQQLGIVSQEPVLFDKSIAENIAYGDNTRVVPTEEIIQAAKKANIHGFIVTLPQGYQTRIGARASQLSGGQKQRIAIARALVRNPRVLLLDEATSALDTQSEKVVQEALDKASEGRTCIIIAHRLSTIQNADVICAIDNGVVAETGTHAELLERRGIYAKLWSLQRGFLDDNDNHIA